MNDATSHGHPLGLVDGVAETPNFDAEKSIVDTLLNLDDFLSGEIRLAEGTAIFYIRPDLEAVIEELHAELASLTDSEGRPLPVIDRAVGDGERSATVVRLELDEAQRAYEASRRGVRMRQMNEDDWTAFMAKHKDTLNGPAPYTPAFYEELIVSTAVAPRFTPEKLQQFRARVGHAVFDTLFQKAWAVNISSGVSVPKSPFSSAALRQQRL